MDITDIELEPLSSEHLGPPSRTTGPRTVVGWMALGLAVVATATLGVFVVRDDADRSTSADQPVGEPVVAILPAAADPKAAFAVEQYLACLPQGSGSADALERQAVNCRRELEQALFPGDRSAPCVPQGAGSADGLERWVQNCRQEVIRMLLARSNVAG